MLSSFSRTLQFFRQHLLPWQTTYLFISGVGLTAGTLLSILGPLLAKMELDQLSNPQSILFWWQQEPFTIFVAIVVAIVVATFVDDVISFLVQRFQAGWKARLDASIKLALYRIMISMDPWFSLSRRNRRLIEALFESTGQLSHGIQSFVITIAQQVLAVVSIGAVVSYFDTRLFFIILIAVTISFSIKKIEQVIQLKYDLKVGYEHENTSWQTENLLKQFTADLAVNNARGHILTRLDSILSLLVHARQKQEEKVFLWWTLHRLNGNVLDLIVRISVGYAVFAGTQSLGMVALAGMYTGRIKEALESLLNLYLEKNSLIDALRKTELFLEITENWIVRQEKMAWSTTSIIIRQLKFSYPPTSEAEKRFLRIIIDRIKGYTGHVDEYDKNLLHDAESALSSSEIPPPEILRGISCTLKKWCMYGIIGHNGAGKSTFIHVLLGYFGMYDGSILYGSQELSQIDRDSLYHHIAVVSQNPFLMKGTFTVRDNLTLGVNRNVTDDELWSWIDYFDLRSAVESLRGNGLDAYLGWDSDLSGGQCQLLAIIRTLVQDRDILILDEGTNQLDAVNEMRVMDALLKDRNEKIILFVTHRMSTIARADHVLCLENGTIAHEWAPKELLRSEKENLYKTFYTLQIGT